MKELVLYHDQCSDGTAAAAAYQKVVGTADVTYAPISYPNAASCFEFLRYLDNKQIDHNIFSKVTFLDFCPKWDVLEFLSYTMKNVMVIDHHKTTIDMMADMHLVNNQFPMPITYILCDDNKLAGSTLVHILRDIIGQLGEYPPSTSIRRTSYHSTQGWVSSIMTNLCEVNIQPTNISHTYELIRVRDVWDETLPDMKTQADIFNSYINFKGLKDLDKFIEFESKDVDFLTEGRLIEEVYCSIVDQLLSRAYKHKLEVTNLGMVDVVIGSCTASQASLFGSQWYKGFPDTPAVAFGLTYNHDYKSIGLSIRSNKHFNCRKVAEQFGGGGHDCASGAPLTCINVENIQAAYGTLTASELMTAIHETIFYKIQCAYNQ